MTKIKTDSGYVTHLARPMQLRSPIGCRELSHTHSPRLNGGLIGTFAADLSAWDSERDLPLIYKTAYRLEPFSTSLSLIAHLLIASPPPSNQESPCSSPACHLPSFRVDLFNPCVICTALLTSSGAHSLALGVDPTALTLHIHACRIFQNEARVNFGGI